MPLIPLQIPPGVYGNGTDLEAVGRWREANLVRWREGILSPIGGWRIRVATAFPGIVRGSIAWQDNTGDRWIAGGDHNSLYVVSASGVASDITPVGLTSGLVDAGFNVGYGGGFYGADAYGTERSDAGTYSEATTWSVDTWGEYLVACSNADGDLYEWTLNVASPAAVITNAPTGCLGLVVTEERFLFALGAGNNPRKVQWCDREDNTTWTPEATNEAGDIILQTPGQIMAGVRTRGQTLILTDTDAHAATYVGPPFVYGFQRVGSSCGLIARKAVATTDVGVFWMGQKGFFVYDGSSVQDVPCDVRDHIFQNINRSQASKCWAMTVGQYGEVWFFYASESSTEIDRYVAYNFKEGHWSTGEIVRSSGFDRGVFTYPMMMDASGNLIEHEVGYTYDSAEVYAESGPVSIGVGDNLMSVTHLYPDEQTQGDVTVTFKTRNYPNATESTHGPYSMANPTSARFTGRQVRMRVTGNTFSDWRAGIMRIEARQRGTR